MEFANGSRDIRFSSEEEESSKLSQPEEVSGSGPSSPPAVVEREHMFDKVVTPSDVGKLNRLVIPKTHAEKYFPLDATANEKGLLLSFEDRLGKPWRFRYSYWNSSQSYVMTKGWSRFVKEKRLDAGDTVSFGRGVGESGRDRLFIDWKRRPESLLDPARLPAGAHHPLFSFNRSPAAPWGNSIFVPTAAMYDHHHYHHPRSGGAVGSGGQFLYFQSEAALPEIRVQPGGDRKLILESMPVIQSQAAAKRVRLFGVNLDCPESDGGGGADGCIRLRPRSPLPLQLRLGSIESSSASASEEPQLQLDLDM